MPSICANSMATRRADCFRNAYHSFHINWIDMWFQSHSTCPLCRPGALPDTPADSVVVAVDEPASESTSETEQEVSPVLEGTTCRFLGNPTPTLTYPLVQARRGSPVSNLSHRHAFRFARQHKRRLHIFGHPWTSSTVNLDARV